MKSWRQCFSFRDGSLVVDTPWDSVARGQVFVNDELVDSDWSADEQGRSICRHGPWRLSVEEGPEGAFRLQIANEGVEPAMLRSVRFADFLPEAFSEALDTSAFRELISGGSFFNIHGGAKGVGRQVPGLDFVQPSSIYTVYQREDGPAMLLGILPPVRDAFSEFVTLHSEPHLEGVFGFRINHEFELLVEPGESASTSSIVAMAGPSGTDLMEAYGAWWHELIERKPRRKPMVGWNSWDYYAEAVSREAMDENLAEAKSLFGEAVGLSVIDLGWQRQWGDWRPNAKFPEGLADFCQHVKSQGGVPGLWCAPLVVDIASPLYLEKPEWFARRADGQPQIDQIAHGQMAYLDSTKPEVIDFIRKIFVELRRNGFEYFKIDFSHHILKARRFADPRVSRVDLIRRVFRVIREEIGQEAYLLSCGTPYESVIGLVDAARATGDVHVHWGHVLRNAGSLSTRWWMHRRVWNNDPDFLVVRGSETARPPYGRQMEAKPRGMEWGWMTGPPFSEQEARAYALLVHLTGGDVVLGDHLGRLNPNGASILRKCLAPREASAVPVDLFESEQDLPRIWISRGKQDTLVGIFNWTEKTSRVPFDPEIYRLQGTPKDFWTDEPVSALPERMARRSSIGLRYLH